ncbi:hypothetical protein P4U43_13780 [Arthrobacter sp. EH-1B-1]|uniref:Uncharacterized protein n=1 Tax=Arthrobacter vasquezii TaxID=2977629 RepID=A0ABT6CXN8_9MICC|nr:hypothetical protein [Arthrobacter vasquezii]MDF9278856.1 hypothetical protein [Arthrobacter vasquezii]
MSYSNERTIQALRSDGTGEQLLAQLEFLDMEIDTILRSGGTSQDVRPAQERFDNLLPPS